jgi:copper homeostasis protein (lipoprotein)
MRLAMLGLTSLILLVGVGCLSVGGQTPSATVRGEAFYRERIAVPPGTQLGVVLENFSRADGPAETIGDTIIADAGHPPYRFEIHYRPDQIIASHRYAVRARLTHEGRLLFSTDQITPVITGGQPTEVQLLLKRAPAPRTQAADPHGTLGPTPAKFAGDLPCADCEAINYHLDLFADRSFYLRTIYRGKPGGHFDDIGSWTFSSDGKILVLQGGREAPVRFAIEGPDSLRMMSQDGKPIVSNLNYTLRRAPEFTPIEPRLAMRGMYNYMADAAIFTECLTGRKMPVAMEGDNRALEEAYTKARREPGEALLVTVEGRIVQRMPMEGPGPIPTLLPEKFISVWPGETCGVRFANSDLQNTYWKLTRVGNSAVVRFQNQSEPHIVLHGDNRLTGSDGCNRMAGSYRLEDDTITFSQTASTMMACPEGMEQEQRFRNALSSVTRYRIVGQHLEFLDNQGAMLVRFEAVALK